MPSDSPRGLKRSKFDHDFPSSDSVPNYSTTFPPLSASHNSKFSTTSPIFSIGTSPRPKTNVTFHRFILVKAPDKQKSLDSVSPFLISRWLSGMVGTTKDIKKLRSGDLLVECANHNQSNKLKNIKTLVTPTETIQISCESHPTLNSSKGVIRTSDIGNLSDDDIQGDLKDQNVTSVRRLIIKKY